MFVYLLYPPIFFWKNKKRKKLKKYFKKILSKKNEKKLGGKPKIKNFPGASRQVKRVLKHYVNSIENTNFIVPQTQGRVGFKQGIFYFLGGYNKYLRRSGTSGFWRKILDLGSKILCVYFVCTFFHLFYYPSTNPTLSVWEYTLLKTHTALGLPNYETCVFKAFYLVFKVQKYTKIRRGAPERKFWFSGFCTRSDEVLGAGNCFGIGGTKTSPLKKPQQEGL